ncbi:MAG: alpha/beta fold hydrolase, partial [Verrucomicrobia bacterium]|nr:alpha/beta fold hydrolase [Verrucomicrobiota bacterium]
YDIEPKAVSALDIRPGRESRVLNFKTSQGKQTAVYLGKKQPKKLWMMFGGNGALALDWLHLIMRVPSEADVGFLLVDYPGYGWCEGNPNPERIQESVDAALLTLAGEWEVPVDELKKSLSCFGHSLGAAVALEAAARMEVREVVVVSSFTSMQAMAEKMVGNPTAYLLRHRFDNVKSLQLLQEIEGVKVLMFHGNSDRMIPVSMSQELGGEFDDIVEYHEVEGAGHNDIFGFIGEDIARVLSGVR